MKKSLILFAAVIMLLITGCTGGNNAGEISSQDDASTSPVIGTTFITSATAPAMVTTPPATKNTTTPQTTDPIASTQAPVRTPMPATSQNIYSLTEALDQGLIEIEINGFTGSALQGVSSGDIIVISFLRRKSENMQISVPLGTTLMSNDPEKQDIVIFRLKGRDPSILGYYRESSIVLDEDEWQDFIFEAYCLDIQKDNILSSTSFSIGGPAPEDIIAMLSTLVTLGDENSTTAAIQIAIWALVSDPTFEEVTDVFTIGETDIATAWMILDRAGLDPGSKKMFTGYTFN